MTTDTQPTAPPQKKKQRRGNDVFANYLVVLLVFAGGALLVGLFMSWGQEEQLPEVDPAPDAAQFAEFAPYTAYVPENVPDDWVATSSRLTLNGATPDEAPTDPVSWDVGFVTTSDEYASFRMSNEVPADFIPAMTQDGESAGDQEVSGDTWDRYESADRRSLVHETDEATLVVTGTADYEELTTLAEALVAQ